MNLFLELTHISSQNFVVEKEQPAKKIGYESWAIETAAIKNLAFLVLVAIVHRISARVRLLLKRAHCRHKD